jgi:hypothetical protein
MAAGLMTKNAHCSVARVRHGPGTVILPGIDQPCAELTTGLVAFHASRTKCDGLTGP